MESIRTARLELVRPTANDLDDLVRFNSDPRVMATLGPVRTPQATSSYLDRMLDHWRKHGFGWWIVRDALTSAFAGRGGLRHASVGGQDEVELGYGLLPEFWGRGLATELARESVRMGFQDLRLRDMVSFTQTTNLASRRVLEKAGFRIERTFMHADLPHVLYRHSSEQFQLPVAEPR